MTTADYERQHSTRLYSPVHQFAAKWFSLADFSTNDFGLMDYGNLNWAHIHADQPRYWYSGRHGRLPETLPLLMFDRGGPRLRKAFSHFREHLRGNLTLGIWPNLDNRFTVIDLDGDQTAVWKDLRDRLIDLRLHFYIEFSGKKGLHFWIFWDRVLPNAELIHLHDFLCGDIEADHKIWPFKAGLVKLPLGLHRKTDKLACFLDHEGEPIPLAQQFEYCLSMRQNPLPQQCLAALDKRAPEDPPALHGPALKDKSYGSTNAASQSATLDPSVYDRLLLEGRKLDAGRHRTLFHLALHLKNSLRLSNEEATRRLADWSVRVPSKKPLEERLRDCQSTVKRIYEENMRSPNTVPCPLTEQEIRVLERECVSSISVCVAVGSRMRKEDLTKRLHTAKKVALAMASLAKTHGGNLEVSYRRLQQLAGVSWNALQRAMKVLVEDPVPVIDEDTDVDPVIINLDARPKRLGRMFLCLHRATYASRQNSVYRLSGVILNELDWDTAATPDVDVRDTVSEDTNASGDRPE